MKSFAILLPMHTSPLSGFYFPDVTADEKYYNGSILEEEYEKKLMVSLDLGVVMNILRGNQEKLIKYYSITKYEESK